MKRCVIVQGLGFGDEGKGATVDFLARELSAELVVRYCGGSQAGHNVVLPDGRRHVFSQFGAGALADTATYLGEQMIIHPPAMHNEADHLRTLTGSDPFDKLVVHPRALVSTTYHQQLNRLRELSRGANRHGSCGHGIGETRHYWLRYGRDAVFAADLQDRDMLAGKLELLRQRSLLEAQPLLATIPADEQWRLRAFDGSISRVTAELLQAGSPLLFDTDLPPYETAIFEGAQGILLDEWRGFHPHTTWSSVGLTHALDLARESGSEELCVLGITRPYLTRHGAGPMPTADAALDAALTDPGNPTNAWQGTMRRGWADLVLLRYATAAVGGPIHGLVINCIDDLERIEPRICRGYRLAARPSLGRLAVATAPNLAFQEQLTCLLKDAAPIIEPISSAELCDQLAGEIAPLAVTADGPTRQDRTLRNLHFVRTAQRTREESPAIIAK